MFKNKKKNQKYGVIFNDGTFSKVAMTPELADRLTMYSPSPLLIVGKK